MSISREPMMMSVRRSFAVGLVLLQIGAGVPHVAAAEGAWQAPRKTPPSRPATKAVPVPVNRKVPRVTPPPTRPVFSAVPTDAEILAARVLPEPLVPIGPTTPQENVDLAGALTRLHEARETNTMGAVGRFMEGHPTSVWQPSLLLNAGLVMLRQGFFTRAAHDFRTAWTLAKDVSSLPARRVADQAIGELIRLEARLGHADVLERLLSEVGNRPLLDAANEMLSNGRQALSVMRVAPEEAFRCGPYALAELISAIQQKPIDAKLLMTRAGPNGVSLAQLMAFATEAGVATIPIVREGGREVAVPGVVHLTAGHFAAVVRHEGDRYLLRDATFGGELWVTETALNEEASGAMLAPADHIPAGWRKMSAAEAATIWGRGFTTGTDPNGPGPNDPTSPAPAEDDGCGCATYRAHLLQASLNVYDTPLRYSPAIGPAVMFTVSYNQRESHQPQNFTYSNLGPRWTTNWLSYVTDDPTSPNTAVAVFLRGGGEEPHSGYDAGTGRFAMNLRERVVLVRTSASPIRYERLLSDGSKEVFAQADGASAYPRRVFMTQAIDPQGNALSFTYDAQSRLVAVTDAVGQVTALAYELPQDIWKITKVTDPFGRVATLAYDADGRLERITDVIQIQSAFTYAPGGFLISLTTPYGTSRFSVSDSGNNRTLEMTDTTGGRERVEFRAEELSIAASEPASIVPTVSGETFLNAHLHHRNTFYWNRQAMAVGAGDLTKAHIYHWLHVKTNVNQAVAILESEKAPLESRVWYRYPNQAGPPWEGDGRSPTVVARVLEDGSTQVSSTQFNSQGRPTKRTDPLGRETNYAYDTNGIDLLSITQKSAAGDDVLESRTFNSQHEPLTVTDASGQTTTYTYTTSGQVATVTNAKNETTTFAYNASKQLTSVTGPVSGATSTFTYDDYGRVRTATGSDGYAVTMDYDTFDRPVQTTYPDGTTAQTTYRFLEVSRTKDRLGRWTTFTYDAMRRQTSVRDRLGRVIQQEWGASGSLNALIDAKGQRTTWERDVLGRITREIRADGTTDTLHTYDLAGRLKTVTDPLDQVTTYTYNLDGSLASTGFTNETISTPDISHAYDAYYRRPTTMIDGNGTTTYLYKAVGTNGAGQLASVDGPLTNDTMVYTYDELGRVLTRMLNGNGTEAAYDSLGRLSQLEFPIGAFNYTYVGATDRRATVTYPNNQTTTYSYLDDEHDFRLQTIHHRNPSAATLSKFDYTYDVVGNITTWRQERSGAAAKIYNLSYDLVDQLTAAVLTNTNTTPTVLKRQAWSYDVAGNRTVDQTDDAVFSTSHNSMNRLQSRESGGAIVLEGSLNEPAAVTIDGRPATVDSSNNFRGTANLTGATTTVTLKAKDASGNETTKQYEVDAAGATTSYTYDANGNLTSDGTNTYYWNALNQLVEVKQGTTPIATFEYDGGGRRTEKVAASLTHQYIYDAEDIAEERITGSSSDTIRYFHGADLDEPLARKNSSDVVTYYLADHLGSIEQETNASGAVTLEREYDPWGVASQGASTPGYAFTSREWDAEIGLSFYRARYYSPQSGRWLNEDPIGLAGGSHLSAYVANNPTRLIDPFGLCADQPGETFKNRVIRNLLGLMDMLTLAEPVQAPGIGQADSPVPDRSPDTAVLIATTLMPVARATNLAKMLQSEAGVAELLAGGGKVMAGAGHKNPIKDIERLVAQHGGTAPEWVKISSTTPGLETHAYKNITTRVVYELKSIPPPR